MSYQLWYYEPQLEFLNELAMKNIVELICEYFL